MSYKSKYFNLDSPTKGWSKEEFVWAVEVLESLNRVQLFRLLDRFEIHFLVKEEKEKYLEDEEIISVLFHDSSKNDLLEALKMLAK